MNNDYERARRLYALWRLLTTHDSGFAVVDTMLLRMGPGKVTLSDDVLDAARGALVRFQLATLSEFPENETVAVAVMNEPHLAHRGYVPVSAGPTIATLRVTRDLPRLEKEFLELCVDPSFPHLRARRDVAVPG